MAEVGLISPIRVRKVGDDEYEVVAGSHRLQAAELLGWQEIVAIVSDDDDLHAELAMIDENLVRAELSPSDRAQQTARRKAIYLELHPETGHGANLKALVSPSLRLTESSERFHGHSQRHRTCQNVTVQRDAERGEKISPRPSSHPRNGTRHWHLPGQAQTRCPRRSGRDGSTGPGITPAQHLAE